MSYINHCPVYYRHEAFEDIDSAINRVNELVPQEAMQGLGINNGMIKIKKLYQNINGMNSKIKCQ